MDKPQSEQHISHQFDADLESLKSHVLGMGGLVERQLEDALNAIVDADSVKAEEILAREKEVNRMEVSVDDEATKILVRRQPAASDLRMVLVITKTVRDLERIGDESKKIAKLAVKPTPDRFSRHYADTASLAMHPAASKAIELHDLRGAKVWSFRRAHAGGQETVSLPAGLPQGMLRIRILK